MTCERALAVAAAGVSWSPSCPLPSSSGHLSTAEFAELPATGERPERHTDQFDPYVNFEFKHLPLFRESVESVTDDQQTLRTVETSSEAADADLASERPVDETALPFIEDGADD